jgi:hypothetical protein
MNVSFLIEESLGPTRQEHNLFVVTDLFHDARFWILPDLPAPTVSPRAQWFFILVGA